jgi:GT2 family glycosyltransferase
MEVFAVIVNRNGGEDNITCLRSLIQQGLGAENIVFVDNASTDASLEKVTESFDGLVSLRNPDNTGYGHGNNQGIELALERGAGYVLLVNNDLELPRYTLRRLLQAFDDDPSLGVAGPRIAYMDRKDRIWAAGGELNYHQNLTTLIGHRQLDDDRWGTTRSVDFVPGCAMLVRRSVFERIGNLEASFFAYHEDVDFCIRARNAGFGVACVGETVAYHAPHTATGGGYNPRRKYMMAVNAVWFLKRHGTLRGWMSFLLYDVLTLPLLLAVSPFRGHTRSVLAKLKGTIDGARGKRVTADALEPGSSILW